MAGSDCQALAQYGYLLATRRNIDVIATLAM
jgi:hypothetical protein